MELIQRTPDCSDFDVILGGETPAWRVLLPEHIVAEGVEIHGAHCIRGDWHERTGQWLGTFTARDLVEVAVTAEPAGERLGVEMTLRNVSDQTLRTVKVEVCLSVNHLPGGEWSNREFIPRSVPLNRTEQGRYWYEKLTPGNLHALTAAGWVPMHPQPDRPDADGADLYRFTPSDGADTLACAVRSLDGRKLLFQTWDVPCRHCTPCPGNACMHLVPQVADLLEPDRQATIRGQVGIFVGDRDALADELRATRR